MNRLAITPLGTSPGVLYTLLKKVNPNQVIIITSEKGAEKVDEVCEKAEYDKTRIQILLVNDPFTGFEEVDDLTKVFKDDEFDNYEEITVNLTGGTSFLQYVITKCNEIIVEKNIKTKRVFTIDRRPFMEQKEKPYVVGEIVDVP